MTRPDPDLRNAVYLAHIRAGRSQRDLASLLGCAPSTVSRRVRKAEGLRDDPLVDRALERLKVQFSVEGAPMTVETLSDLAVEKEAKRILRRLTETGSVLVVSPGMEKAVVMRDSGGGRPVRIAVLSREMAEAFALRDWIKMEAKGRVLRYAITAPGRAALKRLLDTDAKTRAAKRDESFRLQHMVEGQKVFHDFDGDEVAKTVNLTESPLGALARRKGSDGKPFLTHIEVAAGERLREDFERAHLGPNVSQNWDRFLSAGTRGGFSGSKAPETGSEAARTRVAEAMANLGPGLCDIALRCCCHLEGLEGAEKRLGWSARSGKVVLKIALNRLAKFYGLAPLEPALETKSA